MITIKNTLGINKNANINQTTTITKKYYKNKTQSLIIDFIEKKIPHKPKTK